MTVDLRADVDFTLRREFLSRGVTVNRGEWQALRDDRPQMRVLEIYDVGVQTYVGPNQEPWAEIARPNMPWAEDHFQERVGGEPLNPGEQYKNWPWYKQGVEEHKQEGQFSHTYMERIWASHIHQPHTGGIRYPIGDLHDLVHLLKKRPMTRQAYLPIWFPEDLYAAQDGHRVPCSLGYHFLVKQDGPTRFLDCTYYLRSCDFYRYLWDDIYMAGRLLQWVAEKLENIYPGTLMTRIANLHIFADEKQRLQSDQDEAYSKIMQRGF